MKLFAQMLRFPLTLLVYTMEAFVNAMRDAERSTDQTIKSVLGGVTQALGDAPGSQTVSTDSGLSGAHVIDSDYSTTHKEAIKMADQDLGGEDLKYVSYSILFTKADLEATLEKQDEDLVNYATNGGSYGGLKITHFFEKVALRKIPRPPVWIDNGYPENADPNDPYIWKLPLEDEKYVTFIYQVDRRLDKNDPNYPKEQVKVLKEIRDKLKKI